MIPSPTPSILPITSGIDLASLINGVSTLMSSGTIGVIAGSVLMVLVVISYYWFKGQITSAQEAAAAAQAAALAASARAAAIAASAAQGSSDAANQQALAGEQMSNLLTFLTGLSDSTLVKAATSAYGAAKVEAIIGTTPPSSIPLTMRQAIYALYGATN